jgi:hypothetical protein
MKQKDDIFVVTLRDLAPSLNSNKLEVRIMQKKESIFIQHQPFDYESSNNGVFMKLYQDEEFPL